MNAKTENLKEVEITWVKGHAGIRDNERCDELAEQALNLSDLPDDVGYQPNEPKKKSSAATQGASGHTPRKPKSRKKVSRVANARRQLSNEAQRRRRLNRTSLTITLGTCIAQSVVRCIWWRKQSGTQPKMGKGYSDDF